MNIPVEYVIHTLLIFFRALALLLAMPFLSWKLVPVQVRTALALGLAVVIAPVIPNVGVPGDFAGFTLAAAHSLLFGFAMGFSMRLVLATVELAGHFIAVEMGLAMPVGMDPLNQTQSTSPAQWLNSMAMILFFLGGFHHLAIEAFVNSYAAQPNGQAAMFFVSLDWVAGASASMFQIGLAMAAPIVATNILVNSSFAVLGKVTPRMNVFITSFPVRIIAGFSILAGSTGLLTEFVVDILNRSVDSALGAFQ